MMGRQRDTKRSVTEQDVGAEQVPALARDSCFFLDIDGTLLDFSERPDAVRTDAEVKAVLNRLLAAADGAVALISGRPVADIDRLFAPPRCAAAGQHAIERRDSDGNLAPPVEFMEERPFYGRTPVFIGDDLTDEYRFALVNSRRGHSVKVGDGASAARWCLPDAQAVRAWLAAFADHYSNTHDT